MKIKCEACSLTYEHLEKSRLCPHAILTEGERLEGLKADMDAIKQKTGGSTPSQYQVVFRMAENPSVLVAMEWVRTEPIPSLDIVRMIAHALCELGCITRVYEIRENRERIE